MPYDELIKWVEFFRSKPVGWQEDYRTFLLMKSFGAKGNGEDFFPSLRIIKIAEEKRKDQTAGRIAPTGKFLEMMRKAKTGDVKHLPWEQNNGKRDQT